jgi:hypothetical protein
MTKDKRVRVNREHFIWNFLPTRLCGLTRTGWA